MKPDYIIFYQEHYPKAFARARSELRDSDVAYDLVMNLFTELYSKYDEINNPVHYMNSALSNLIISTKGKKSKDVTVSMEVVPFDILNMSVDDGLSDENKERLVKIINKVLTNSDEITKGVFELKILKGMNGAQIQKQLSLSYNSYTKIIEDVKRKVISLL